MARMRCRRCDSTVGETTPTHCPVCGLGLPDRERPIGIVLAVILDALLCLVLAGVAVLAILLALDVGGLGGEAPELSTATFWVLASLSAVMAVVVLLAAVGVGKGRGWGRPLQMTVSVSWMAFGVTLLLLWSIRPLDHVVADIATAVSGAGLAAVGFLWIAAIGRPRPGSWFETMRTA